MGIKELFNYKAYKVKVTTAENIIEDEFIYGSITNSRNVGGFKIFRKQEVKMNDGLFEVVLIKKPKNIFGAMYLALKVLFGFLDDKNVQYFKTSSISFEFDKGIFWALDGEKTDRLKDVSIITLKEFNSFILPTDDLVEINDNKYEEDDDDDDLETYNIIYHD